MSESTRKSLKLKHIETAFPKHYIVQWPPPKLRSPAHHYNSVCFSSAVRTIAADARSLGQAQCCLSVAKGNKNKELPFEEIAKGKYERICVCHTIKTDLKVFVFHST